MREQIIRINSLKCSVSGCSTTRITALTPCYYVRTEDYSQLLVTTPTPHALNSRSHPVADLTAIPVGIPWDPWDPSLPHSHAHLYVAPTALAQRPEEKKKKIRAVVTYPQFQTHICFGLIWSQLACMTENVFRFANFPHQRQQL